MVAAPSPEPITVPPVTAAPVLLLVHVPPAVPSFSTIVVPMQSAEPPVIAAGNGLTTTFTVLVMVAVQPELLVATTV